MKKTIISELITALLLVSMVSALSVNSVSTGTFVPGKTGNIAIEIVNNLEQDAKDVSLRLDFTNLPFTPVGSSERSLIELETDEDEEFTFTVKSANNIIPGDYLIPFTISYSIDSVQKQKTGSVGITIKANSELQFSVSQENQVIGQDSKISLKIINKGFGDAKFVLIKVIPEGFTIKSEQEVYIGTIDADDFEIVSFDAVIKDKDSLFVALVEYKDFDNNKITTTVTLPLVAYTLDEAITLGIAKKDNTLRYIGIAALVIIIWLIYRYIKKKRRLAKKERK